MCKTMKDNNCFSNFCLWIVKHVHIICIYLYLPMLYTYTIRTFICYYMNVLYDSGIPLNPTYPSSILKVSVKWEEGKLAKDKCPLKRGFQS